MANVIAFPNATAEIDRLQAAKRRALQLADERAIEANELRLQVEKLSTQVAELKRGHRSRGGGDLTPEG